MAQSEPSASIKELFENKIDNTTEALKNGDKMLQLSKTPADSLLAHFVIGDLKSKQLEYGDAITHLKKAAEISVRIKDYNSVVSTNTILALTYWNAGLKSKYKLAWSEVEKYADKSTRFESFNYQHKSWLLEEEGKFCESIKYAEKNIQEILTNGDFSKSEDHLHLAAHKCGYAYYLLKCNQNTSFEEGRKNIAEVEKIINEYSSFDSFYYSQKYFLCKAIIANHDNDKKNTLFWFKKALDISIQHENYRSISLLMDEGENLNISTSDLQYADKFITLLNKKTKEIAKISDKEILNQQSEVDKEKNNKRTILGFTVFSILVSLGVVFQIYSSKRNSKKRFLEIIEQLQNENSKAANHESQTDISSIEEVEEKSETESSLDENKKVMSNEKEAELIKKLLAFEKGKEYRDNNFTVSNMAALFETNTRYLNYIISTQRDMNFNDYINHLRIKHVVEKLYNDPNFLNYKISYLSEYCGFSSHSRFTHIFKKELGISPSDFINNLKESRSKK